MDNYITLAELRKTAEALLVKTKNELENKVSIEDINNDPIQNDDQYYKVASIGDKDLLVDKNMIYEIIDNAVIPALSSGTLIATINGIGIYAPSYTDADGVSY